MPEHDGQPALHDLVTCLRAPTTVLSAADGQLRGDGAHGVLVADARVIATALLTVGTPGLPADRAEEPEFVAMAAHGADLVEFVSVVRTPWHPVPDPAVWIRRRRQAVPLGCAEAITVSSVLDDAVELTVRLRLATDLAGIWAVRAGRSVPPCVWRLTDDGAQIPETSVIVTVSGPDRRDVSGYLPSSGEHEGPVDTVGGDPLVSLIDDGAGVVVCWPIRVAPGHQVTVAWSVGSADTAAVVGPAAIVRGPGSARGPGR